MGCCWSAPCIPPKQKTNDELVPAAQPATPRIGEGTPLSISGNSRSTIKKTTTIKVDSFKGNVFVNEYLIIKDLGSGSFGRVKLCLNVDDNCLYALKVVSKKQMRRRLFAGKRTRTNNAEVDLMREINVMRSLEHPNVVRLFEVIDDPSDDKLIMVMEYVEGGEVLSTEKLPNPNAKFMPEDIVRRHFRDLVKGLDYLHYQNVIHRDIKPDNLLLTSDGTVKLSDFGSACHVSDGNDAMFDTCGTRPFFSPEMCQGEGLSYSGKKADIYAAGVVLYVLIFQRLPFEAENPADLFEKICNDEPDYSGRSEISPDLIDLIRQLLNKNPEKRPSLEDIMQHDWLTNRSKLSAIKSSRLLSVPSIHTTNRKPHTALTPSIETVFQQIPEKKVKYFSIGSNIIEEGQQLTGVYLIKKGLCVVVPSGDQSGSIDPSDHDGDTDFLEDETLYPPMPIESPRSAAGKLLMTALTQPSGDIDEMVSAELSRFQSLNKSDVIKGVGRRTTYQHTKLKELVNQASAQSKATGSKHSNRGMSQRGPGSIIGLDLALENSVSKNTIKVVEPVEAIFVKKTALDKVFSSAESQLQLRLLIAKLQKMELLGDTVQKLAALHSDFLHMDQLRALVRNVNVDPMKVEVE